jgi:hypothetical protein
LADKNITLKRSNYKLKGAAMKKLVKLRREGSRYIGPKGEYYEQLTSQEQLRPVYGL